MTGVQTCALPILYRRLQERTVELERLASRMVRQHEAERRRLSRELHDETAQVLSAVQLQLGIMRESAGPDLAGRLDRAMALMDTGIQGIRNVLNDLRPSLLDDLGLAAAMQAHTTSHLVDKDIQVSVEVQDGLRVPPEIESTAFRIYQEITTNVLRHAGAENVSVELYADGEIGRAHV